MASIEMCNIGHNPSYRQAELCYKPAIMKLLNAGGTWKCGGTDVQTSLSLLPIRHESMMNYCWARRNRDM